MVGILLKNNTADVSRQDRLLKHNTADVSRQDRFGRTVLYFAVTYGHFDVVGTVIEVEGSKM